MRRFAWSAVAALALMLSSPVIAASPTLSADIQPLGFLVGRWTAINGAAENGAVAKGVFSIEPAAGGTALLRRDRTDLVSADGKARTSFEQVMLIYPETGAIHADYFDGTHAIHYVSATVDPGKSVTFNTVTTPGSPRFRLTYTAKGADKLTVKFEMAPPGAEEFRIIASGEAIRR